MDVYFESARLQWKYNDRRRLALLLPCREVLSLSTLTEVMRGFTQSFQGNFGRVPQVRQRMLLFRSLRIHYSPIILQVSCYSAVKQIVIKQINITRQRVFFVLNPILFASCTCTFSKWCKSKEGVKRSAQ
jgi:hypothetical protein